MNLKDWQEAFYRGIFDPTQDNIQKACEGVDSTDNLSAEERLGIYRGSILGGLTSGLSGIYPVCEKLVGEQYFTQMVSGYLKQYPSGSPDLGNYGEHLPQYISDFQPAKELFYLPDVAKVEWLWHQAFNAAETPASNQGFLPVSELANIAVEDQARIQFCLNPSASLMKSDYPVHKIWAVNQNDYEGDQTVNLDDGETNLIVWRSQDFGMRIDVINEDELKFLTAINQGKLFAEIAEMSFSLPISELLPPYIQMGLISGFRLGKS
ncbi:DNA-binding domain-containing protein [Litoribacillus peritrichatus]|uniref:Putative DNA-binding domain-containing protein n=1 Tax=Litoribacillus peritrichatus TaxID=718191 RepID=A0ABP7N6A3_9GAMM